MELFLAIAASLALLSIFAGIALLVRSHATVEDRLATITARLEAPDPSRQLGTRPARGTEREADREPSFAEATQRWLNRADFDLTVGAFIVQVAGCTILGAIVGLLVSQLNPVIGIAGAAVGFLVPVLYVNRRIASRSRAFRSQLADAIDLMSTSVHSGQSLLQALELVAHEAPEPTASEFSRALHDVGLGLSPKEALARLGRRLASQELHLLVTALEMHSEAGGDLGTLLESTGRMVRERARLKRNIDATRAQVLGIAFGALALSMLLALVLYLVDEQYLIRMLRPPYVVLPGLGLIALAAGFVIARQIVDSEV